MALELHQWSLQPDVAVLPVKPRDLPREWTPDAEEPLLVTDELHWHPPTASESLIIPLAAVLP